MRKNKRGPEMRATRASAPRRQHGVGLAAFDARGMGGGIFGRAKDSRLALRDGAVSPPEAVTSLREQAVPPPSKLVAKYWLVLSSHMNIAAF